ncbi:hypothetical protein [Plesiomonas shigelloides]|uniref:hypothetical protein n=1 Tax=Plesiomonas shigelloides TaxID=703 RepID=UPI0032612B8F
MTFIEHFIKNKERNSKRTMTRCMAIYNTDIIDEIYSAGILNKISLEENLYERVNKITTDEALTNQEKEELLTSISDENSIGSDTIELIEEMQIIALYKTIETVIKKMLLSSGLINKDEIKKLHRVKELKVKLKEIGCDITTLSGFQQFDELRCLNNCIKHSGYVDKELAKHSIWKKNEKITNCGKHYVRLKDGVAIFIDNFLKSIVAKIA